MPYYEFKSRKTGDTVAVFRSIKESDTPPDAHEVARSIPGGQEASQADLEAIVREGFDKCISRNTGLAHAPGYRPGGKGLKGATYNPTRRGAR